MSFTMPWWLPLSVYVWALQMVVFHGVGYAFEWCDRTRTMRQFKVRDIDRKSYRQLMPVVLFNQCFVLLPCMVLMQAVGLCFTGEAHLPLWRFLLSMVAMGIGHDIVQYATHRHLLHRPSLMRLLRHSVHHSTGASKGISACYMSGQDFFLEIALPYLLPLALIGGGGSDILFHSLIAGLGAVGGVYEHSGYDFAAHMKDGAFAMRHPLVAKALAHMMSSHAHGEHHSKGNVSFSDGFGSPAICDTAFGTRWDVVAKRRREAEVEWETEQAALAAAMPAE